MKKILVSALFGLFLMYSSFAAASAVIRVDEECNVSQCAATDQKGCKVSRCEVRISGEYRFLTCYYDACALELE